MTISDRLLDRIQGLTAIDKTGGVYRIQDDLEGVHTTLEVEAFDRLGLLLRRVEMRNVRAPAPTSGAAVEASLRKQAETILERVKYLSEDFKVVEVDALAGAVQLRSDRPHAEGPYIYFTQIILSGGNRISIERLRRQSDEKAATEAVAMNLSRETFVRLIQDLAAIF